MSFTLRRSPASASAGPLRASSVPSRTFSVSRLRLENAEPKTPPRLESHAPKGKGIQIAGASIVAFVFGLVYLNNPFRTLEPSISPSDKPQGHPAHDGIDLKVEDRITK